jgi:hypothetical protein
VTIAIGGQNENRVNYGFVTDRELVRGSCGVCESVFYPDPIKKVFFYISRNDLIGINIFYLPQIGTFIF